MNERIISAIKRLYENPVTDMWWGLEHLVVNDPDNGLTDFQRGYMSAQFGWLGESLSASQPEFGWALIEKLKAMQ